MRTIKQGDLALVVRLFRGDKENVQSGLVGGELLSNFAWSLDDPQVEVLGLDDEIVTVANFLLYLCNLLAGEARNDAVDEGSVNTAAVLKPLAEAFGQFSEVDVLADAVLQHVTVEEDKLAGEDDEALGGVAIEGLIAAVEQLYELAGIGAGGLVVELAGGVEGDAGLGSVRDDETHLRLVGQSHVSIKL